jgi:hypothetical protein
VVKLNNKFPVLKNAISRSREREREREREKERERERERLCLKKPFSVTKLHRKNVFLEIYRKYIT